GPPRGPPSARTGSCATMDGVSERLSTFFGALIAAALVAGAFVLLFHVLDSGGEGGSPRATIVRVQVPAGTPPPGRRAKPGHAALGTKAPRRPSSAATARPSGPNPA